MGWLHKKIIRPLLFRQDSETAHNRVVKQLAWVSRNPFACGVVERIYGAPELPTKVFGLAFPNPVGLAAGMDKHAAAVPGWAALGFGFSELGGVTWHAQAGNPPPRMFRAIADEAVINRMGFNNSGAEAVAQKLAGWKRSGRWPHHPVGINLGKSKITPLENAAEDYANSFRVLRELADFFVVNVSSPNTPNLRQLQDKAALTDIFAALQSQNSAHKPILVKIALRANCPSSASVEFSARRMRGKKSRRAHPWCNATPASSMKGQDWRNNWSPACGKKFPPMASNICPMRSALRTEFYV